MKQAPQQIADSLSIQLMGAFKAHHRQAEDALHQLGIYSGQDMILLHLWNKEGIPQSQFAVYAEVEPPAITKMLQRMERAGVIERRADPEDARVSLVYLTDRGKELEKPVLDIWQKLEAQTLQGLSEAEQALLRRLLQQISSNLS